MFEKVNPAHPDKIADRIAGALVDLAYAQTKDPKIAVEVLIGHGKCHIIAETSVNLSQKEVEHAVTRISGITDIDYVEVPQDKHLAQNQKETIKCGDNGIFKGVPISNEEALLSLVAKQIYDEYPTDGKYIIETHRNGIHDYVICQSCVKTADKDGDKKDVLELESIIRKHDSHSGLIHINPIGDWTGGTDVDTGATNRKLGSDMGRAVTGGGLHGKDLSKADVSVNIYAHIKANQTGKEVCICCAIGDKYIDGLPYAAIVEIARDYIQQIGGFEKFAEWGLLNLE